MDYRTLAVQHMRAVAALDQAQKILDEVLTQLDRSPKICAQMSVRRSDLNTLATFHQHWKPASQVGLQIAQAAVHGFTAVACELAAQLAEPAMLAEAKKCAAEDEDKAARAAETATAGRIQMAHEKAHEQTLFDASVADQLRDRKSFHFNKATIKP